MVDLSTTNVLLGIMAAVSLVQGLVLIGIAVAGWRLYRGLARTIADLEERRVAPLIARVDALMGRVDAILVDVHQVTERIGRRTERVDSAIQQTIDRVDETAGRVRTSVVGQVARVIDLMGGARSIVEGLFGNGTRSGRPVDRETPRQGGSAPRWPEEQARTEGRL